MDRDRSENRVDPVEREAPSTGENDTGDVGSEQARIIKERRKAGTAPKKAHSPLQTKKKPEPLTGTPFRFPEKRRQARCCAALPPHCASLHGACP